MALVIISANPVSIPAPFSTILVPMKEQISKYSEILDHEPGQVSNMENKIIGKNGQRKRPEEFANIVPALVPWAQGRR